MVFIKGFATYGRFTRKVNNCHDRSHVLMSSFHYLLLENGHVLVLGQTNTRQGFDSQLLNPYRNYTNMCMEFYYRQIDNNNMIYFFIEKISVDQHVEVFISCDILFAQREAYHIFAVLHYVLEIESKLTFSKLFHH